MKRIGFGTIGLLVGGLTGLVVFALATAGDSAASGGGFVYALILSPLVGMPFGILGAVIGLVIGLTIGASKSKSEVPIGATRVKSDEQKMPARLWIVAAGLILLGLMNLIAPIVFDLRSNVALTAFQVLTLTVPPILLLIAAILLLMRKPKSNHYVMFSVMLFFGLPIGYNAYPLLAGLGSPEQMSRLVGALFRGSVVMGILGVTMYSDKVCSYLDAVNVERSIGHGT